MWLGGSARTRWFSHHGHRYCGGRLVGSRAAVQPYPGNPPEPKPERGTAKSLSFSYMITILIYGIGGRGNEGSQVR